MEHPTELQPRSISSFLAKCWHCGDGSCSYSTCSSQLFPIRVSLLCSLPSDIGHSTSTTSDLRKLPTQPTGRHMEQSRRLAIQQCAHSLMHTTIIVTCVKAPLVSFIRHHYERNTKNLSRPRTSPAGSILYTRNS